MSRPEILQQALSAVLREDSRNPSATRRSLMLAPLLAALPLALSGAAADASGINPHETAVTLPAAIKWPARQNGFPPHSSEMATL